MKFCPTCGTQLEDSASFCTGCGATLISSANRDISYEEYLKTYADPKQLKEIKTAAIIGYVLLAINLIVSILFNWFGLIDVIVLGALVLGMHLKKRKGFAVALLVVSIVSTLISLIATGTFTGYLWIILSICALVAFKKLEKGYQAFKEGK